MLWLSCNVSCDKTIPQEYDPHDCWVVLTDVLVLNSFVELLICQLVLLLLWRREGWITLIL